ncbi:MAG: hypothetical protein J7K37_04680 [Candidatus Omnitrophica bacterium]|nr:hypothetical protein [Candidatus Omnitrophota bacterium]
MRKTRNCCEITAINGEKVVVKSTLIKIKQKLGDRFFAIPFSAAIGEEELLFLFVAHHCAIPNECYILIGKKGFFVEIVGQILFLGNKLIKTIIRQGKNPCLFYYLKKFSLV